MSRQLFMLRHAKAVTSQPGIMDGSDHARALSDKGRRDAAAMGLLLRGRSLTPALALVSTTARTRETFALLGPFAGRQPRRLFMDALYLADPDTLLDVLREKGGTADSIMLIGHNPGIHELALQFASRRGTAAAPMLEQGFPTCTLALFAIEGDWSELATGRASLQLVLRP